MSKVTTRLANQDIVNIARQQYENQQKINEAQQKILENLKLEIDLLKKQKAN